MGQEGQSRDKKEATQKKKTNRVVRICFLLNPRSLFSRVDGGESREPRWREKNRKKEMKAAIFVIAFLTSAERKVVGKVSRNLNSLDSQGAVALIF